MDQFRSFAPLHLSKSFEIWLPRLLERFRHYEHAIGEFSWRKSTKENKRARCTSICSIRKNVEKTNIPGGTESIFVDLDLLFIWVFRLMCARFLFILWNDCIQTTFRFFKHIEEMLEWLCLKWPGICTLHRISQVKPNISNNKRLRINERGGFCGACTSKHSIFPKWTTSRQRISLGKQPMRVCTKASHAWIIHSSIDLKTRVISHFLCSQIP